MPMVSSLLSLFTYLLPFLIVLTPLVFFHELGHFLVARWVGVQVDVFSIGFGPEIFGITDKKGTRWRFALIPLGGYIKMLGDEDAASKPQKDLKKKLSKKQLEYSIHSKKPWQKIAVSVAGPAANYLLAIVLFWVVFLARGIEVLPPVVGDVVPESAAAKAGFMKNDVIRKVGDQNVESFRDVVRHVQGTQEHSLSFVVQREQETHYLRVPPREKAATPKAKPQPLGLIATQGHFKSVGFFEGLFKATEGVFVFSYQILVHLGRMFSGSVSLDGMGGVLMIAKVSGDVSALGVLSFLFFAGVLSVNLGFINLLPIPVLDGGHILLYTAEAIWGRALSERFVEWFYRLGFAVIISLFVFTTWNDCCKLQIFSFFKDLFA